MSYITSNGEWLLMSKDVFVDNIDDQKILLYNTKNGKYIVSQDRLLITIIDLLYDPKNLGAISAGVLDADITDDVRLALTHGNIYLSDSIAGRKPIVLLPILNLQYDINRKDKDGIDGRLLSIGSKTRFISGAKIRLSSMPVVTQSQKSDYRKIAARQYPCPSYQCVEDIMTIEALGIILDCLQRTSTSIVDLIFTSLYFKKVSIEEFIEVLGKFPFAYQIHMYADDFKCDNFIDIIKKGNNDINFVLYDDCYSDNSVQQLGQDSSNVKFVRLIYKESDIPNYNNVSMAPVWTGDNVDLFKKYVWLNLDDIKNSVVDLNTLFRNQKLNSNFFGIIDVDIYGNIYAHGSKDVISNIKDPGFSLANVVAYEMRDNKTWRLTRDLTKCNKCPFRFICSPISVAEIESQGVRMCNINF